MRLRRIVLAAALASVLVAGVATAVSLTRAQAGHPGCADIRAYQERYGEIETLGHGERSIAVLGDSYSAGDTLSDRGQRWTDVLVTLRPDVTVTLAAVGGTGYANPGLCGRDSFRDRIDDVLARADDILIIQGGINDALVDPADVERSVPEVLDAARADQVVVVGPIDAPAISGEDRVDALLEREAAERGMTYISTLDWDLPFGPDRLHLTADGHRAYAERVRDGLVDAGIL
jgi:lysophospholipase L1-like esterase